jgi:uncharacterized protein
MAIRIDETFTLQAPIERVFQFVVDPNQVVHCLPGAELTGETGERTYTGRIKLKVGPVVAAYSGQVRMLTVDAAAHRVQLLGEGRESGGAGSAKMTMTTSMRALSPSATEVHVEAELDVAGKIVTFGRGMIENVNKQLFRQFVDCLRVRLESPATTADATPLAEPIVAGGPPASVADAAHAPADHRAPEGQPLRIVPLVLRALWESLAKIFRGASSTDKNERGG